jgi:hypothetical protein
MDSLETIKAISSVAAAIIIPLVVAFVGHGYSRAIKERELQGRFVELAVEILRAEPTEDVETQKLRSWATEIINNYSGVPLPEDTREALIKGTRLPAGRSVLVGEIPEIQSMLATLGFYSGPIDGKEGPALSDAIRRFQTANKLPADGMVGPHTYGEVKRRFEARNGSDSESSRP